MQTSSIKLVSVSVKAVKVKEAAREKNMLLNVNPDPDPTHHQARSYSPEIVFEGNCRHPQHQMDPPLHNLRNSLQSGKSEKKEKQNGFNYPKLKSISKCPSRSPGRPPKNLAHHPQPKSADVPPVVGGVQQRRRGANKDSLSGKSGAGSGSGSSSVVKAMDMSIVSWQGFHWPPTMGAGEADGNFTQEMPSGPTNLLDLSPNLLPSILNKVDNNKNQEPAVLTTRTRVTTDPHDDDESVNKQIMARVREESVSKHRNKQKLQKQEPVVPVPGPVPVRVPVEQQEFNMTGTATIKVAGEESGSSQDLDVLELYPSDDELESRCFGTIRLLS